MKISALVGPGGRVTRYPQLVHDALDVMDRFAPGECVPVTLAAGDPERVTDTETWSLSVDPYIPEVGPAPMPRALPDWWSAAVADAATAALRRAVGGMITAADEITGGECIIAGEVEDAVGAHILAVAPGARIHRVHAGTVVDAILRDAVVGVAHEGSLVRRVEDGGIVGRLHGAMVECVAAGGRVEMCVYGAAIRTVEAEGNVADVCGANVMDLYGQVQDLHPEGIVYTVHAGGIVRDVRRDGVVFRVSDGGRIGHVHPRGLVLDVAPGARVQQVHIAA